MVAAAVAIAAVFLAVVVVAVVAAAGFCRSVSVQLTWVAPISDSPVTSYTIYAFDPVDNHEQPIPVGAEPLSFRMSDGSDRGSGSEFSRSGDYTGYSPARDPRGSVPRDCGRAPLAIR